MAGIGAPELLIVLVIILVIFGGAKLPKLARSLGEAKKEFETSSTKDDGAHQAVETKETVKETVVERTDRDDA